MKSTCYYIILLLIPLSSFGQNNFINSAQSLGIGDCYTTQEGIWSIVTNPAGVSNNKEFQVGIGIKNNFSIKELSSKTVAASIPSNSGVFGLSIQQYGFELYSESKFGLSFSKSLSETFKSGIKIDYYNTHIQNTENRGFFTFEIGMKKQLNRNLSIGSFLHDPLRLSTNSDIPSIVSVGLQYKVNPKVNLYSETESLNYGNMNLKFGLEYQIIENMYLRTGYNRLNNKNTFGFAYQYRNYILNIATYHHQTLGFSSQFSINTYF